MTKTKLTVISDSEPATEATDYLRFQRFVETVRSLWKESTHFWETVNEAVSKALDRRDADTLKRAIWLVETNLPTMEAHDKRLILARQERAFFERDALWDALPGPETTAVISRAEVKRHVLLLLDSFPVANIPNPRVFIRTMIDEVHAESPNPIVLEAAFGKMRRTFKKIPTIAEVFAAIDETQSEWSDYWDIFEGDGFDTAAHFRNLLEDMRGWLEIASGTTQVTSFEVGDRVAHPTRGVGRVTECEAEGVYVDFEMDEDFGDPVPPNRLNLVERAPAPPPVPGDEPSAPPASEGSPSDACEGFSVGQRVLHSRFGAGIVAAVDGKKLTVTFDTAGRKMVLDSFVERLFE